MGDSTTLRSGPAEFPTAVGSLLLVVGIALVARGRCTGEVTHEPWSARALAIIAVCILAVSTVIQLWGYDLMIEFGPAEFAAALVLRLSIALALARMSRLRAFGMLLVGLLLSAVGIDAATGVLRLTFGSEILLDGIALPVAVLALLLAADGALSAVSPNRFLAAYAKQVRGWRARTVSGPVALAIRAGGVVAVALAAYLALLYEGYVTVLVILVVLGALGVACRLCGWNRLALLLGLGVGTQLEEDLRRALLISQGDPEVFLGRPIAAALILGTVAVLALAAWDRFRVSRGSSRTAAAG